MLLLDVPTEIFANIIHLLVEEVGVFGVFNYRLVCSELNFISCYSHASESS